MTSKDRTTAEEVCRLYVGTKLKFHETKSDLKKKVTFSVFNSKFNVAKMTFSLSL